MRARPLNSYVVPRETQVRQTRNIGARKSTIWLSTAVICGGLAATYVVLPNDSPNHIFRIAAIGAGLSLCVAFAIELLAGLRSMLRTDLLMLAVLYVLTLFEFLFPQHDLSQSIRSSSAFDGTTAVLLGFGGLAIGRHIFPGKNRKNINLMPIHMSANSVIKIFIFVFCLGYFHIFYSVGFDIFEALRQMQLPRFSQSWARGRLGGWPELLVEVGALIYLIPPLSGYIFARQREFSPLFKIFVFLVLVLTLFYGFSGGTRNVIGVYAITLIASFFIFHKRFSSRQVIFIGIPSLLMLAVGMYYMLQFRQIGLSNYSYDKPLEHSIVFVDYNLVTISRLTDVFPNMHPYLGWEVPYTAVIRPIPRALWPGKPEGLSLSIEDALGVRGYTLAATFVGEAYVAGGFFAVAIGGLLFGAAAARWNRVGQDVSSNFRLMLYVSGFFCAAITMRSFMSTLPAALPTIGLWVIGKLWVRQPRRRVPAVHQSLQPRVRREG